ncbi:hypothetical protein CEXT_397311 [Caerostris extrusa]|uniref:SP-RING-type domain-containing protein n=1 Tax=Caerostris extrusa TaxID=172846 RepID=A0AAV4R5E5_CAEEX|nr:hypothetical protein CEXT_397311 [Caerostris extrusa]
MVPKKRCFRSQPITHSCDVFPNYVSLQDLTHRSLLCPVTQERISTFDLLLGTYPSEDKRLSSQTHEGRGWPLNEGVDKLLKRNVSFKRGNQNGGRSVGNRKKGREKSSKEEENKARSR